MKHRWLDPHCYGHAEICSDTCLQAVQRRGKGIGTIVTFQESILYIPVINNWRTPADNPSGYHHPGQRSLEYEDVRIETPDGEKIHGWFIPAPRGQDASLAPTVLFCHENAGNIGLRVDEFDHMHKKLKVNQLVFDYRELVKELGVRLSG